MQPRSRNGSAVSTSRGPSVARRWAAVSKASASDTSSTPTLPAEDSGLTTTGKCEAARWAVEARSSVRR
ncbi:hypothetical protein WP39_20130 [Streptomyces sp. 604F]|nr:hypothetical protein [Streptomyces sp. 604F]